MQQFSEVYLAVMASILTVIASVFTFSKWTRQIFLKRFSAKPRDKIVKTNFTYLDVQSGVKVLLEYCDDMNIDMIIGINRGGAIIGGILGKHL